MTTKKRILFMAEAVTLAHVARPYVLANSLDPDSYDVHFAADPRFNQLFDLAKLNYRPIKSIPTAQFLAALAKGSPVYDAATLKSYVQEDLVLLDELQPAVVVGDFRLSLAISARLRGVPYITITNAYWGPHTVQQFPVPDIPVSSIFGPKIAQHLFDLARPIAFRLHTRAFNKTCADYGLPPLSKDLREIYTHADLTLYADLPGMFETSELPPHHHFIGPLLWSPDINLPEWWNDIPQDKPVIYLTLGSSGNASVLPAILNTLGKMPVTVLLAWSGHENSPNLPANTFAQDYLPGHQASARADLVICNGGSPTTQQALAEGVPVIGIPGNLDQYLNMQALQQHGVGTPIRSGNLKVGELENTVSETLSNPRYKMAASELSNSIKQHNAPGSFRTLLAGMQKH